MRPLPARRPVPAALVRLDAALAAPVGPVVLAVRVPVVLLVLAVRVLGVPGPAR